MPRKNYMPKEGLPPLFSTPKPPPGGYTHCIDKIACNGVELEPGRRPGGRCKACMDHRMANRQPTGPASPPLLGMGRAISAEALERGRKRGGQATASHRRKDVPDDKLQKTSGMLTRISETVMRELPQQGIFKPVPCVLVRCQCGAEFYVKRDDWARAHRRPNGCAPCLKRRNREAQAERERVAREAAEDIEGRASGKGRAA